MVSTLSLVASNKLKCPFNTNIKIGHKTYGSGMLDSHLWKKNLWASLTVSRNFFYHVLPIPSFKCSNDKGQHCNYKSSARSCLNDTCKCFYSYSVIQKYPSPKI
jgi:hypothetical protein